MESGEFLSPGKLMQLKYHPGIYTKSDEYQSFDEPLVEEKPEVKTNSPIITSSSSVDWTEENPVVRPKIKYSEPIVPKEYQDNNHSCIPLNVQRELKKLFDMALSCQNIEDIGDNRKLYFDIRDKILHDVMPYAESSLYKSQLKLLGDYNLVHGLNVSILSTLLARKMRVEESTVRDITLGALLHDIGKNYLPSYMEDVEMTRNQQKIMHLHAKTGYGILRYDMLLPDTVARIALEHHETNDGSGFPSGLSGSGISLAGQIVSICNVFDNITSNRFEMKVKTNKDAVRLLIKIGSRWFSPHVLYTFVNMSNYNDVVPVVSLK